MPFPVFIVDSFVGQFDGQVLRGNPAAVMLLDNFGDATWLQSVAAEFNLSETAFLVRRDSNDFDLRWFTPQSEVALCGHATLASSHVVWQSAGASRDAVRFHTRSGVLSARKEGDEIALDFPATPRRMMGDLGTSRHAARARRALGVEAPGMCVRSLCAADDWLFQLESAQQVRSLRPDFATLALALQGRARGAIVTARACETDGCDFVSRFFAPGIGIAEDPVTGSAHTKLAPFWSELLGKDQLTALQLSPRGGVLRVKTRGERVEIAGRCQIRVQGQWLS